ncbi:MAG: polymorphic toxin type 23 domain-containing protein [Crocinitomicaceae bacterium]
MVRYLLILLFPSCLFAQVRNDLGLQVALQLQFGTHINKIGVGVNGYWLSPYTQLNLGSEFSFYLNGLGPKGTYIENRAHVGVILIAGKQQQAENQFYNPSFHQSRNNLSLGYSYLYYWDNRHTSQLSGAFSAQIRQFTVVFENDLFAGQGKDRFRTGILSVYWKDSMNLAKLSINLWTGDPKGAVRVNDSDYPAHYGYKNLSTTQYGKYSNGILSFGYHRALMFQQSIGMDVGVDAEQIRHFFQNKLVHDAPFRPKKSIKEGDAHYPMLTKDGLPYLFLPKQEIRKPVFFFQMGIGGI